MKKVDRSLNHDYGCIKLFASDIKEIVEILSCCEKVKLVADYVEYESVEEFTQNVKESPRDVRIASINPYVTIELAPRWAKLSVSSNQALDAGVFYKVDSVLSKCERKPRFIYKLLIPTFSIWMSAGLLYAPVFQQYMCAKFLFLLLTLAWFIVVMIMQIRIFSKVYPIYKHEQIGFIKRNKDSMIVGIVSALIGAFAGLVGTKFVEDGWGDGNSKKVDEMLGNDD